MATASKEMTYKGEVSTTQYAWKDGVRFPVSAQVAGEELTRIGQKCGLPHEMVPPKLLVNESRPEDAPLHPAFTWDDTVAAELHREQEARQITKSVRIIQVEDDQETEAKVIAFVSVVVDGQRGYVASAKVMSEDDLRRQALSEALSLLKGVKHRFGHLEELAEVSAAIDRLLDRAGDRIGMVWLARSGSARRCMSGCVVEVLGMVWQAISFDG